MDSAALKRTHGQDPLLNPDGTSPKRRCMPSSVTAAPTTRAHQIIPSPFGDVLPKFTSEEIMADILDEMRRLHRRKQLSFQAGVVEASSGLNYPMGFPSSFSGQPGGVLLPPESCDQALFTPRQVELMFERMMKKRVSQIRDEYNHVLSTKLAEQYDAFLKFTQGQIQKRIEGVTPTYLS